MILGARGILPIVGAVAGAFIGSAFGMPMLGAQVGFAAGATADYFLFPPPPVQGPRLDDRRVQTSTYGLPIPTVYGTFPLAGNIIWAPDLFEDKDEQSAKGGSSVETFTYFGSWAVALCIGQIDDILRIKFDDEIVVDRRSTNTGPAKRPGIRYRIYYGSLTQNPDPLIQEHEGVENTPAFRGVAYIVFEKVKLTRWGNRLPNVQCEVVRNGTPAAPVDVIEGTGEGLTASTYFDRTNYRLVQFAGVGSETIGIRTIDMLTGTVIDTNNRLAITGSDAVAYGGPSFGRVEFATIDGFGVGWVAMVPNSGLTSFLPLMKVNLETGTFVSNQVYAKAGTVVNGEAFQGIRNSHYLVTYSGIGLTGTIWSYITSQHNAGTSHVESTIVNAATGTPVAFLDDVPHLEILPNQDVWYLESVFQGVGQSYITYLVHGVMDAAQPPSQAVLEIARYHVPEPAEWTATSGPNDMFGGGLAFWEEGNALIVHLTDEEGSEGIGEAVYRFDLDSLSFSSEYYYDDAAPFGVQLGNITLDGMLVTHSGSEYTFVDLRTLTVFEVIDQDPYSALNGFLNIYDEVADAMWITDTGGADDMKKHLFHRGSEAGVSLQSIVEAECTYSGYNLGTDVDATALAGITVKGTARLSSMASADFIAMLCGVYFWRFIESDGKLKAVLLGGSSVQTLTAANDLGATVGGQPPDLVRTEIVDELELPAQVTLSYIRKSGTDDEEPDWYEPGAQTAKRVAEAITTKVERTGNVPVVLSDDEAAQIAEKALWLEWASRFKRTVSVTWAHLKLDPCDVITLSHADGETTRDRVVQADVGDDLIIRLQLESEDYAGQFTSTVEGSGSVGNTGAGITLEGPSIAVIMDVPPLRPTDTTKGFYWASSPAWSTATEWSGTSLEVFQTEWTVVDGHDKAAIMGTVLTAPSTTAKAGIWQTADSLKVKLITGTLQTKTRLEVSSKANWAYVGGEILAFQTATLNGDGTYTLTGLLRGLQHTEDKIAGQAVGARFILLDDPSKFREVDTAGADLNVAKTYRGNSYNWPYKGSAQSFTNTLRKGLPPPVNQVKATRDGSNNVTITWHEVNRLAWGRLSGPVGSSEATKNYVVEIYLSGVLKRTITTTASANGSVVTAATPQAYYDADDITADGLTLGAVIDVKVYQISTDLGQRGRAASATV